MKKSVAYAQLFLAALLVTLGCDDPVPNATAGLVVVIRSFEATGDPALQAIDYVKIETKRVVVNHATAGLITVDTAAREVIVVNNGQRDRLVGQYQVPPGKVLQVRLIPSRVTVVLKDGSMIDATENPNIPSWKETGLKLEPLDGLGWSAEDGQLSGVRALFHFDVQMLFNKGNGYKLHPTVVAEQFAVSPPRTDPGFFADEITVVFKPGTTPSQIDAINAGIGATIISAPTLGTWYRIKLPPAKNLLDAFDYYDHQAEVAGCMPATNFALFSVSMPTEGTQDNHQIAKLPAAWVDVNNALGTVGSHQVRVAVIDTGVAIDNVDIAPNIAINQNEIPAAVRAVLLDADGDGLISFDDLNATANAALIPMLHPDINGNGMVDGKDLLASPAWADGVDDDDFDNDPATFVDDLVGWNFSVNEPIGTNDPSPTTCKDTSCVHGTYVASIVGAVGDNGIGIAGTAWRTSIVPLRVTLEGDFNNVEPDVRFLDAAAYAEQQRVDIANSSFGWNYASKNADLHCAKTDVQMTTDIPPDVFDKGTGSAHRALAVPPFTDGHGTVTSRVLYVFAAGNSSADIGQFDLLMAPSEVMRDVVSSSSIDSNAVIVGSNLAGFFVAGYSNYGDATCVATGACGAGVDLYAPGSKWTVENPNGTLNDVSGTSFAAPVVSGTAALVLSKDPTLRGNPTSLREKLITTGDPAISFLPDDCRTSDVVSHVLDASAAVK